MEYDPVLGNITHVHIHGNDFVKVALWLDSDTLAVRSLHPLMELAARIPPPGSEEPGPRLGVAFNGHYYKYLVRRGGERPRPGSFFYEVNMGVFLIRPGQDNALF